MKSFLTDVTPVMSTESDFVSPSSLAMNGIICINIYIYKKEQEKTMGFDPTTNNIYILSL